MAVHLSAFFPPLSKVLRPSHLEQSLMKSHALSGSQALVSGGQEPCCVDLARSIPEAREILDGFIEEASFELEGCIKFWKAEQDIA